MYLLFSVIMPYIHFNINKLSASFLIKKYIDSVNNATYALFIRGNDYNTVW